MSPRPTSILAVAICSLATISLKAQTFSWVPTATGTTYNWTDAFNWDPSTGFPNAAGAIANVNNDIVGAQTIRLQQGITVGTLNFGDANGTHAFNITSGTGTNTLIFDSGTTGVPAQINVEKEGNVTHTISAPITLASNLNVTLEPTVTAVATSETARLTISGAINLGSRTLTLSGGYAGPTDANQFNMSGGLSGDGTIINNSNSPLQFTNSGKAGFTGVIIANGQGTGGSNTGTITLDAATSLANVSEIVLNGALTNGSTQLGGSLHSGATVMTPTNPSQRFTSNTMTFNSGTLRAHGFQATPVAAADLGTGTGTDTPWRRGEEFIQDTIATMDMNSGFSRIEIIVNGTSTAGTILTATQLIRSPGATLIVSNNNAPSPGPILGGPVVEDSPRFFVGNINSYLIGGDGTTPTNLKIIPWIGVSGGINSSTAIGNSAGFSTYGTNGVRLLDTSTEYAASIAVAAPTDNVNASTVSIPFNTTINSLRYTAGTIATNIGFGNVLTVTSGGVFFLNNNSKIGATGDSLAGTLDFGSAEGVIWSNASNTNTIGASISGSLGITKTGTGTLILTGQNTYSGLTYVGAGTLQIGDGLTPSNLGITGDVTVANGATLSLLNGLAIADNATLTLEQFGLFNGKVNLGFGVDETIGSLFFDNAFAQAGTYGSTLSGAMFQNDTYFSGSGILTVVPEPGSAAMLLGGIVGLLGLRRRRM